MTINNYNVLGIMSGTSLDGVDLAHISFSLKEGRWGFEIHESDTVPYTDEWINRLKNAVDFTRDELDVLNKEYTQYLAEIINTFISSRNITILDAVCSHGHTILHQPDKGFTLQIGNRPELAALVHNKVVCDFRVQDVKLGGQGAPLVPIGDKLLFSEYDFCLNLGGFSNISFDEGDKRLAFDVSPVNTVLNHYANILGYDYDNKGSIAASGNLVPDMFDELNALEFYKKKYPKSLGFEFVKTVIFPLIEKYKAKPEDVLHTFTIHVALQIANAVKECKEGSLLITGGGAYNDFLIEQLRNLLPGTIIKIPDDNVIQYKEALIFGLLGVLRIRGDVNVLASVTGALHDHSSGAVYELI